MLQKIHSECSKHADLQVQPGHPCNQRIRVSTWLFGGVVQPDHTLRTSWKNENWKNLKMKNEKFAKPLYIYCCPRESVYISGNALVSGCNAGNAYLTRGFYWYYECLILNLFEPAVRHNEVSVSSVTTEDQTLRWFVVTLSPGFVRHAWERTSLLALINT